MSKAIRVSVLLKGRELSSHLFKRDRIVIGRDPDCDVRLDNSSVSRHHALIERNGPGYLLRDLGSANGTQVGDDTVASVPIEDGGTLRITKFDLAFRVVDDPSAEEDVAETPVPGLGEGDTIQVTVPKLPEKVAIYPLVSSQHQAGWSLAKTAVVFLLVSAAVGLAIYLVRS